MTDDAIYSFDGVNISVSPGQQWSTAIRVAIVVDTAFYIPPRTGVGHRVYWLARHLAARAIDVHLFVCNRLFNAHPSLEAFAHLHVEPFTLHIIAEGSFYNRRKMVELVGAVSPTLLQFEDPETALYLGVPLRDSLDIPLFVELHDFGYALRLSLGASEAEAREADFVYFSIGSLADRLVCMTDENRRAFIVTTGISSAKLALSPNGIDIDPTDDPKVERKNDIAFVGNLYYEPNAQAVRTIAETIIPSIREHFPEVQCVICGMGSEKLPRHVTSDSHLQFKGFVENLHSALRATRVAVAPLQSGSGMKVKILEYSAAGLPIVGTPEALAGYEHMTGVIRCEDIGSFASAIVKLLKNGVTAQSMGQSNQHYVRDHLSWPTIVNDLIKLYEITLVDFSIGDDSTLHQRLSSKTYIPQPLWLSEKRVTSVVDENNYTVSHGILRKL